MSITFFDVFTTVVSMLVMMLVGVIISKLHVLSDKSEEDFSTVVLYVGQAFLVFMSFQKEIVFSSELVGNVLIVAGITVAVHILSAILMRLLIVKDEAVNRVIRYAGVFGNCGFMGLPFLSMLFPTKPEIMLYGAVIIAVFNVISWTLGVYIISGNVHEISWKKIVYNPVIIAVVLGFVSFFACKGSLLNVISNDGAKTFVSRILDAFNYLGNIVTPLSMIVIGLKLGKMEFKKLFASYKPYLACFLKLVLTSCIAMLSVAFFPLDLSVKYTVFFLMSMPSATSTALFAVKFDTESEFASITVLLSTMLSVVTIPLMFMLAQLIF